MFWLLVKVARLQHHLKPPKNVRLVQRSVDSSKENKLLTFAGGSVWRTRQSCSGHHHWNLCSLTVFSPALETNTLHNAAAATVHALGVIRRGLCPLNFYHNSPHRQQQRRSKMLWSTLQTTWEVMNTQQKWFTRTGKPSIEMIWLIRKLKKSSTPAFRSFVSLSTMNVELPPTGWSKCGLWLVHTMFWSEFDTHIGLIQIHVSTYTLHYV